MAVRYFSLVAGLLYLALGLLGAIPAFLTADHTAPWYLQEVGVSDGFGYLFGIFPINAVESVLYITIGLAGLVGYVGTESFARLYADTLAVWLGILGVLGLIPIAQTVFGLFPVYGSDVVLHLGTAAIAAYFGFALDRGRPGKDPSVPDAIDPDPIKNAPIGSDS